MENEWGQCLKKKDICLESEREVMRWSDFELLFLFIKGGYEGRAVG